MDHPITRWLFPPRCPVCKGQRRAKEPLCDFCKAEYENEKKMPCHRCGAPHFSCGCRPRYDCPDVLCYLWVFRYKKTGSGGRMILTIKNRKDRDVIALLGRDLAETLRNGCILSEDALVTYVPRRKGAILQTGTDQARMLAQAVAKECGLGFASCLLAQNGSASQKELGAKEREEAADEKYGLKKDATPLLLDRQVILVDDVLTTGATVSACARLLKESGARTVICLCAGRG